MGVHSYLIWATGASGFMLTKFGNCWNRAFHFRWHDCDDIFMLLEGSDCRVMAAFHYLTLHVCCAGKSLFSLACWHTEGPLEGQTRLKCLLKCLRWEYKLCFDMFGDAATRRPILDYNDFGHWWYSWEGHTHGAGQLWLNMKQLGGWFWMETSHFSSL